MAHRNTVVNSDCVELGCIASHTLNLLTNNLTDFVQVRVSGNKLCERVYNSDDGLSHLLTLHACRHPKGTGSSHSTAIGCH